MKFGKILGIFWEKVGKKLGVFERFLMIK
jgi:hypothetical protein